MAICTTNYIRSGMKSVANFDAPNEQNLCISLAMQWFCFGWTFELDFEFVPKRSLEEAGMWNSNKISSNRAWTSMEVDRLELVLVGRRVGLFGKHFDLWSIGEMAF